jgi:hypothetical protein
MEKYVQPPVQASWVTHLHKSSAIGLVPKLAVYSFSRQVLQEFLWQGTKFLNLREPQPVHLTANSPGSC